MLKSMTLSFACKAGALPKSKIIDVVDQWESSDHPEFWDRNVNSLYNAFTEVYKGNLVALPNRSDALHSVLDSEVALTSTNTSRIPLTWKWLKMN